jgi:ubiquinone/menaquinone biosynthesis C-methylase UbiE
VSKLIESEKQFWNSDQVVKLFSEKNPSEYLKQYIAGKDIEGLKTLDHGCGGGRNADLLAEKGAELYGVDVNPAMISQTIETLKDYYGEEAPERVEESHIVDLPLQDNEFKLVVSMGVLHQAHDFSDFKTSIDEISRVIEKEGDLVLEIFTNEVLPSGFEIKREYEGAVAVRTAENLPMTLLSEEKFMEIMANSGFELIDSKSYEKELETGMRSILSATFRKVE